MEALLNSINDLKNSDIKKVIDSRINEFKEFGEKSDDEVFCELCFCLLTANYDAEKAIKIQEQIHDGFCTLSENDLPNILRGCGYRFPNVRSKYIVNSRDVKKDLKGVLQSFHGYELRDWFVDNVKGLGYKEASHFLRNIGFDDYAIIDFHIVDLLVKYKLIEKPKTISKKKYLEVENVLKDIAKKSDLTLAELDLYLWYLETGKILK